MQLLEGEAIGDGGAGGARLERLKSEEEAPENGSDNPPANQHEWLGANRGVQLGTSFCGIPQLQSPRGMRHCKHKPLKDKRLNDELVCLSRFGMHVDPERQAVRHRHDSNLPFLMQMSDYIIGIASTFSPKGSGSKP